MTTVAEHVEGRQDIGQENELQAVEKALREEIERGARPAEPVSENRRAATAQIGEARRVAPIVVPFAVEAHLRKKGLGHDGVGELVPLVRKAPPEARHRRIEPDERPESVEEDGGRRRAGHGRSTIVEPAQGGRAGNPSYTAVGVHVLSGTGPLRSRRVRLAIAAVPAAAAVLWAPSFIAEIYDGDGRGGTAHESYLTRPDEGWRFLADAARLSRGAKLGTAKSALALARDEVWTGPPVVPTSVRLIYGGEPFRVAVPPGGTAPAPQKAVARPRSRLSWLVEGRIRNGPVQPIGLIDYQSRRVVWNIRPLPEATP